MISFQSFISAAVIFLAGGSFVSYIWQTLRGTVVPHRMTYFFWFLSMAISFVASMMQGVTVASQTSVIITGVGCFLILVASFYQRDGIVWEFSAFDWACAAISTVGLILWQVTDTPNWALLFAIIADFVITLPILMKSYKAPETESAAAYAPALVAHVLTLAFLVDTYNFQSVAMTGYLVFNLLLIFLFILMGWVKRKKWSVFS